eukprot:TRINITY_DN6775_c0_g1_i3.p1 TRINITY_DN6775_c0_g1~~TRINITY_DN6775_c0_g1_i3.p1  ORF type:complete len:471 (+),score=63.72 TRINITY_DN6775_c0_g1_i3:69-1481(+)
MHPAIAYGPVAPPIRGMPGAPATLASPRPFSPPVASPRAVPLSTSSVHTPRTLLATSPVAHPYTSQSLPSARGPTASSRSFAATLSTQDTSYASGRTESLYYTQTAAAQLGPSTSLAPPIFATPRSHLSDESSIQSSTRNLPAQLPAKPSTAIPSKIQSTIPSGFHNSFPTAMQITNSNMAPMSAPTSSFPTPRSFASTYATTQSTISHPAQPHLGSTRSLPNSMLSPRPTVAVPQEPIKAPTKPHSHNPAQLVQRSVIVEKEPAVVPDASWDSIMDQNPDHPYYGPWKAPIWGMKRGETEDIAPPSSQPTALASTSNSVVVDNEHRLFGESTTDVQVESGENSLKETLYSNLPRLTVRTKVIDARGLLGASSSQRADVYCQVVCGGRVRQTRVLKSAGVTPVWNEEFVFTTDPTDSIRISILHQDKGTSDLVLGTADLSLDDFGAKPTDSWVPLDPKGELHLRISVTSA